jgi:2-phospho-L-lactate guanylyltransferase
VQRWAAVVPVKRLDRAKSRLHVARSDGSPIERADLALAFATDTVAALLASPSIVGVVVVCDDARAARELSDLGARVVPDAPDAGLNAALAHGADHVVMFWPDAAIVAVSADLPSLRSQDVDSLVALAAQTRPTSFVSDTSGTGTTVFCSLGRQDFVPAFGHRSRAAHRLQGAVELLGEELLRVRRDVDTDVDLWDAERLGVGPATHRLLQEPNT